MFKSTEKFVSDIGITFIATAIQTALAFVVTVFLGRWVGAEDLGLYRLVLTVYGLTILLAGIGIPSTIIKFSAEFKNNKEKINEFISSSIIVLFLLGIIFSLLLYLLSGLIARLFDVTQLAGLIRILSIIYPFSLVNNILLSLLNGLREMKKFAIVIICRGSFTVLFTVILLYLNFKARGAVIGLVAADVILCVIVLSISKQYFRIVFKNIFPTALRLAKFGIQILGAGAINIINKQLDIIIIGLFLLPYHVGYYAAAVSLSRFFWLLPASIQRITYPATTEYWSKKKFKELSRMVNKSIKFSSLTLVLIGLAVLFFGNYLLTSLFRKDFVHSFVPLQILLIGTVIRGGLAQPIGATLTGIGRPDLVLKLTAFMLFTNALFNLLLIPRIGIIGAAIATSISLSIGAFINLILIVKVMLIKIDWKWILKLFGILVVVITLFKVGSQFMNQLLLGSILLVSYILSMITLLLTKDDWNTLKSLSFLIKK